MSESWRITTTLLTVLLITGGLASYVAWRARWAFRLPRVAARALLAVFAAGLASAVLSRALGLEYASLAAALGAFGGAVMLGIVISSVLLLPVELARGAWRVLCALGARTQGTRTQAAPAQAAHLPMAEGASGSASPAQPARRAFIAQTASAGALGLGLGSAVYGTLFGRRDYTVETVPIRLEKLPAALSGLTIVQLSDLHVGTYVGERELSAALSLVRDAKADVVVLTGDLLDHDASYAPVLARFARSLQGAARYGVFAIPGNHDHYAGAARVLSGLRDADCKVCSTATCALGSPAPSSCWPGSTTWLVRASGALVRC
jgi:uncharacterized protein